MSFFKRAFTILEIILAIGVLTVLAGVSFVLLAPNELRNQGQDSKRISDLTRLHLAVSDFAFKSDTGYMGSSNVVYLSLPDSDSSCGSYVLPRLPSGWSYICSNQANYLKTNGSGWLPITFSDLERLPQDPLNNNQYFYAYVVSQNRQWVLASLMRSEKFLRQTAFKDGGIDDSRYEIGTDLRLWSYPLGMAGYWQFDSLAAVDLLGQNNGNVSGASLAPGKINNSLSFDGVNDFVRIDNLRVATTADAFNTVEFWMNWSGQDDQVVFGWDAPYALSFDYGCFGFNVGQGNLFGVPSSGLANQWVYATVVFYNGVPALDNSKIYLNGQNQGLTSCNGSVTPAKKATPTGFVADWGVGGGNNFSGLIDNLKIYNRELTSEEISASYKASR